MQDRELVLEQVGALADRRERKPERKVILLVPAGADPDLDPSAAHVIDRRDKLHEVAGIPERHGADKRSERDPRGLPRQPGEDRPRVGRRAAAFAREARVVVAPEEALEAAPL